MLRDVQRASDPTENDDATLTEFQAVIRLIRGGFGDGTTLTGDQCFDLDYAVSQLIGERAALRSRLVELERAHDALRQERHTPDEIRAINQAAACLQGILWLNAPDADAVAQRLFAIAGNPIPAAARLSDTPHAPTEDSAT